MLAQPTSRQRSELMSRIRSRGNARTELALLKMFRTKRIYGWRRHLSLPGKPDFAFPKQKVAVFVDGCFWHGCPKCYTRPKTNRKFWDKKREDNMARDKWVKFELRKKGWRILRLWEHSLAKQPDASLQRVVRALHKTSQVR
jgi:DNA mismatch endonuclease (patch repair protein)